LILEFETSPKNYMWDYFKAFFVGSDVPREVRIPLYEVATLSYGWGWGKPPHKLLLQVTRLAALGNTPSIQGQVQLYIPHQDRDEARRLVKSLGRPGSDNQSESPGAAVARARREVAGPALGLLLGSVLDVLLFAAVALIGRGSAELSIQHAEDPGLLAAFLIVASAALVQALGAVMMLRLTWYPLAATASILGMIPRSPAFFISLPFGIWTCVVLGKPEVTEAFFDLRHSPVDEPAAEPDPRSGAVGRVLSFVRSVGGYFLPTMAPRTMKRDER
jgi:hypothetical protein